MEDLSPAGERQSLDSDWINRVQNVFGWCVIILMLAIVLQVFCSFFDINPIAAFSSELWWFGKAITLNSLLDFQWHLLVIVALLPAGMVWHMDGHVRVDFLYSKLSATQKSYIDLIGNIVFAFPFLFLGVPAAWNFAMRAWSSDQGSNNDGLNDLYFIKFVLVAGLVILAIVLIIDTIRLIRRVSRR